MSVPSTNGPIGGRDAAGRYTRGNPGGPGNPMAAKVAALRKALFAAVRPSDLKAVVKRLVDEAKGGDVQAARVLLDRLLGAPASYITLDASIDTAQAQTFDEAVARQRRFLDRLDPQIREALERAAEQHWAAERQRAQGEAT